MSNIHVCLVSSQATPNLTPVVDPDFRPDEVILVTSPDMERQANWLQAAIESFGIRVSIWPVGDPYDVQHLQTRLQALLTTREDHRLALNATGGTKLMAIAAHEVFLANGQPIFYVHPKENRIIWLSPRKPAVKLSGRLTLPLFLAAHGGRVRRMDRFDTPETGHQLMTTLVRKVDMYTGALNAFNFYCVSAKESLCSVPLKASHLKWQAFLSLVNMFQDAGIVRLEDDRLHFESRKDHSFAMGGWLEAYVLLVLRGLEQELGIQDLQQGAQVNWKESSNELDVAFLAGNRMHIVECKTFRYNQDDHPEHGPGAHTLYKLDYVKDFGGIQTKAMLVSFRHLGDADRQRAMDLGIETVEGRELQQLEHRLRLWVWPNNSPTGG